MAFRTHEGGGGSAVLCTLIEKIGSGPRDVGAKMLVARVLRASGPKEVAKS